MITGRRVTSLVSASLLTALALSGCGTREAQPESTPSSASSATTTPTPAATNPAGQKIAPADLPAVVANRTYRGEFDGEPYAEYYAADGTLRGKQGTETYTGSWKVVGEQLCFSYPKPAADAEVDCYDVLQNGDAVTWVDSDGAVVATVFVEGNPDNL